MRTAFNLHFAGRAYTATSDGGAQVMEWLCHAERDLNALGALAAQKAALPAPVRQNRQVLFVAEMVTERWV
jgi:RIO-like serine/threonine protein kinase